MWGIVEPRVRKLVAHHLGVTEGDLTPDLSLIDDLAADSLDLAELAVAVEEDLDVLIPDDELQQVRSYRDLVEVAIECVRARLLAQMPAVPVVAHVRRPTAGAGGHLLERAGTLTPYLAETLADDVLRAGPGARIDLVLPDGADDAVVQRVHDAFTRIAGHGVEVRVSTAHEAADRRAAPGSPRRAAGGSARPLLQ